MDKNKCPKLKSQFTFWKKMSVVEIYISKLLKEDGGSPKYIFQNYLKNRGIPK